MHRGGKHSYRREYQPNSQRDSYQSEYNENGKYEQSSRSEQDRDRNVNPQALIESLEKQLDSVQAEMTKALTSLHGKDNEKFDLIFSILTELQIRQGKLDESVRQVQAQLSAAYGGMGQPQPVQQVVSNGSQPAPDPPQTHNPVNGNMGSEVTGQVGSPTSAANNQCMGQTGNSVNFMPGQMAVGQMVGPDGSQGYFTGMPIMMTPTGMQGMQQIPQNMQQMGQMTYAVPQMMQPQAVQMQFISQGGQPNQVGSGFQWSPVDSTQQTTPEPNAAEETASLTPSVEQ